MAEKRKAEIRSQVMRMAISPDYPFDIEAKLLRTLGIHPKVMLDVGANTGIYSSILEDIVGSENLYMFEPLPDLYRFLKLRFKKANVFNFALSYKEGQQSIRVPFIDGNRADTRASFNQHVEPNQTGFEEVAVRFFPLDRIAKDLKLQEIGFVKIDVEGHELEVLEGGRETLARFKPMLLIEIESRHHQFPITKIFSWLDEMGYRGYYINTEAFELLEVSRFVTERDQDQKNLTSRNFIRYLNNFFFVHETSSANFVEKASAFLNSEKLVGRKTVPA